MQLNAVGVNESGAVAMRMYKEYMYALHYLAFRPLIFVMLENIT